MPRTFFMQVSLGLAILGAALPITAIAQGRIMSEAGKIVSPVIEKEGSKAFAAAGQYFLEFMKHMGTHVTAHVSKELSAELQTRYGQKGNVLSSPVATNPILADGAKLSNSTSRILDCGLRAYDLDEQTTLLKSESASLEKGHQDRSSAGYVIAVAAHNIREEKFAQSLADFQRHCDNIAPR